MKGIAPQGIEDRAGGPAPVFDMARKPFSLGNRLAAMTASLKGRDTAAEAESLRQEMAFVVGECESLREGLRAANETIASLSAAISAVNARRVQAEAAITDEEARIARFSIDLCASVGVPLSDLPAAEASGTSSGVPATSEALEEKMRTLSVTESIDLFRRFNASRS